MAGLVLQTIAEKVDVGRVGEFESLHSQIKAMPKSQLVDFFRLVQSSLPRPWKTSSYFAYAANSELSGYPAGTKSYVHRARKLKEACYFATCYADQLVLIDPFSGVLEKLDSREIDSEFISDFSFFLGMLIMIDPIIDKRIVTFTDSVGKSYCANCFYKLLSESDKRIPNVERLKRTTDAFLRNAEVRLISIDKENHECTVLIEGPSEFFGDEPIEITFPKRGLILTDKSIGKLIPKQKLIDLEILYPFSRYSVVDISTKEKIANKYGINRNFVSSREISLLKRMFGHKQFFSSNFESDALVLMADSLSDLVSLREQEWHHFERFRNAFHACADVPDRFDLEEVYRETVIPAITNIRRIIEKSKSASGKEIIKSSGIAVFAVTSAVMTAGLSTLLSATAGILGGGHFVKSMIPAVHDYLKVPEEAKDSEFYYAWKLKNVGK